MIRAYTTFPIDNTHVLSKKNWQTVQQIIGMRSQIEILSDPVFTDGVYSFTFRPLTQMIYATLDDSLHYLKQDSTGVPVIIPEENDRYRIELTDTYAETPNIWYEYLR
jgi:hypothetical protein